MKKQTKLKKLKNKSKLLNSISLILKHYMLMNQIKKKQFSFYGITLMIKTTVYGKLIILKLKVMALFYLELQIYIKGSCKDLIISEKKLLVFLESMEKKRIMMSKVLTLLI